MKKYTDIDIQYIQKKIRQTVWENHNYIDDLIILAEYIKNPPNGYIANMQFSLLKFHNKQEYLDLLQELNPRKYEFELGKIKENQQLNDAILEEKNLAEKLCQEDWKIAGGNI